LIALALFVFCWFIPFFGSDSAFDIFGDDITAIIHSNFPFRNVTADDITPIICIALLFAAMSIVFAWVIQCVIVAIRTKWRNQACEAA
jgi:hypothetical protein